MRSTHGGVIEKHVVRRACIALAALMLFTSQQGEPRTMAEPCTGPELLSTRVELYPLNVESAKGDKLRQCLPPCGPQVQVKLCCTQTHRWQSSMCNSIAKIPDACFTGMAGQVCTAPMSGNTVS